jgi:CheY-like chemotaxis protein
VVFALGRHPPPKSGVLIGKSGINSQEFSLGGREEDKSFSAMRRVAMAKKIMIVEDDPSIIDYLADLFKDNGYETCTASNGAEALEIVKAENPDLITLDFEMPESWGNIFYRKIQKKEKTRNIPIIIISGIDAEFPHLEKAVATLRKPFDREELLEIVKKTIG